MPRQYPPEERHAALRALARSDCDYGKVSEATGVAAATLRVWVSRYGLPDVEEAKPKADGYVGGGVVPEAAGARPSVGTPGATLTPLEDLPRAEYLADRIRLLESIVRDVLACDSPTWSAVRPVIALQADLHAERVDVIRTEGQQLDLSDDPRAVAREIERLADELRVLGMDLDDTSTLVTNDS